MFTPHEILDKGSFCTLVIACQETMFRTAKSILRQDEDAEDAVQDAICTAFASRDSLRDVQRFKPWLLRILTNKCYDLCRKRRPTVDLEDMADRLPSESQDHDQRMTLWQAVLSLPEDLRVPVTLFYYEDLSVREIGQVLGISEAAVKTRLSRGRGRLHLLLEEK